MPSGTQKTEYTLFEPFGERRYLTKYIQSTPSILFRAHSPRASGVTTASYVASTAAVDRQGQNKPYDDDILTMDTEWARDALERHVTTWTREDNDNFMSWTSSPLFALQHAIRREATDRNPPSTARQVKLSILFTSKLPAGCFVPSVALLDAYDAHYNADMQRRYYHGEYLSQGRLDIPGGAMITITLEDLVASGLYRLYPGFELDKQRLCTRVARLRTIFLGQKHDVIPKEVRLARTIAEKCCSEAAFRYVLFASLLGLKSRNILDPGLQSVYSDLFHVWGSITEETFIEAVESSQEVPEHSQFVQLMNHFQEQERERIQQFKFKSGLEVEQDITSALDKLQISNNVPEHEKQISKTSKPTSRRVCICSTSTAAKAEIEFALCMFADYTMEGDICRICRRPATSACLYEGCFSWCNTHCATVGEKQKCPVREFREDCDDTMCIIVTNLHMLRAKSLIGKKRT